MCSDTSQVPVNSTFLPQKLTKEEISDPYQVIYELFDFAHLPRVRELLWEFFKTAVTGNYSHELQRRERSLMVTIYERIEKLVEAAHIINESRKIHKRPIFETYPFFSENIESANLIKLRDKIEGISSEHLQSVVETIIRVTDAEKLFLAGSSKDANNVPQIDFLVLLPSNAKYSYADYQAQVQSKCSGLGSVLIWFGKIDEVYKLLQEGYIFYSCVCRLDRLLYDNRRVPLPEKMAIDIRTIKVKARNLFSDSFANARSFLDGAEYYATTEQRKPAAFLLHQAAEHAFRSLLGSLTTFGAYGHNLKSILRHCIVCAPELNVIFPKNNEVERKLFSLLNNAYVYSRYKTSYEISQEELMLLLDRISTLHNDVEQFFEEKLIAFENLYFNENS